MSKKKNHLLWYAKNNKVISCDETNKVLNENYEELKTLIQNIYDDAILIGCDEDDLKKNIQIILIFFLFFDVNSKEIECQGAKLRIINKITTEKNFFIIPLSQTLELDNAKVRILRCLKIETDGKEDEIAILNHKPKVDRENQEVLGWIFKSSQYLNLPVNPMYDIRLEGCLIEDPIFLKRQ